MACQNLDAHRLELSMHGFFEAAQVQIRVKDDKGRLQVAKEWYRVPLVAFQEFVRIVNDEGIEALKGYGFAAARGRVVRWTTSEKTSIN